MSDLLDTIQRNVEATVARPVTHRESVAVVETILGETVWDGMVEVFDVVEPPPAVAYGWAVESDEGPQYVTVKGWPPVDSPLAAVRVWLVSPSEKMKPKRTKQVVGMIAGGILLLLAPVMGRVQYAMEQPPSPFDAHSFSVSADALLHGYLVALLGAAVGIVTATISAYYYVRIGRLNSARHTKVPQQDFSN